MKLILVLSVVAYSYADKLDRTYLPPPNAASAGGSAGLMAPFASKPSGPAYNQASSGFGSFNAPNQPQGSFAQTNFGQSNGPAGKQFGAFDNNQGLESPASFEQRPERPQAEADKNAEILKYENENNGENFAYSFETSNGIAAEEAGVATNGVQAQGGFSYTGDDGQTYSIKYTADENGYLPEGEHLPTPHPIPEEILKSIEINAMAAAAGTQEGAYKPEEYENESQGPQQYNANSFTQGQAQGQGNVLSQQYGAPNAGFIPSSAPQKFNQPQSKINQYNQGAAQRPAQGPSQGPVQGSAQVPSQLGAVNPNTRGTQSQNGYQYNRPQGSFANQGSSQYRPQQVQPMQYNAASSGSQPSGFPRPSGQVFNKPSTQYGSPSGSEQPARSEGPFNALAQKQSGFAKPVQSAPAFPKSQPQGPASARPSQNQFSAPAPSYSRPSAQRPQTPFNSASQGFAAAPKSQMPAQASYQYNRPSQQGPFGQSESKQGSYQQPAQQQSFGQSSTQQGSFGQPTKQQGSFPNQQGSFGQSPAQQNSFGQSGAQQRPSSPNAQSNIVAKDFNQGSGSSFGAPRQPPSFSPEEGYKY